MASDKQGIKGEKDRQDTQIEVKVKQNHKSKQSKLHINKISKINEYKTGLTAETR